MGTIRRATELPIKENCMMLIYGASGTGKTTLALSAKNPLLFDLDNGISRVQGELQSATFSLDDNSFKGLMEEIKEANDNGSLNDYDTLIFDSVGKLIDMIDQAVMKNPKMVVVSYIDGIPVRTLGLSGFGQRGKLFSEFCKYLNTIKKNVVFVAQEKEEDEGDIKRKFPVCGSGSNTTALLQDLDLVGRVSMAGTARQLTFNPTDKYFGKNSCKLTEVISIPKLDNDKGQFIVPNVLLAGIQDHYLQSQHNNVAINKSYSELLNKITDRINSVTTVQDLKKAEAVISEMENSGRLMKDLKFQAYVLLNNKRKELEVHV